MWCSRYWAADICLQNSKTSMLFGVPQLVFEGHVLWAWVYRHTANYGAPRTGKLALVRLKRDFFEVLVDRSKSRITLLLVGITGSFPKRKTCFPTGFPMRNGNNSWGQHPGTATTANSKPGDRVMVCDTRFLRIRKQLWPCIDMITI